MARAPDRIALYQNAVVLDCLFVSLYDAGPAEPPPEPPGWGGQAWSGAPP